MVREMNVVGMPRPRRCDRCHWYPLKICRHIIMLGSSISLPSQLTEYLQQQVVLHIRFILLLLKMQLLSNRTQSLRPIHLDNQDVPANQQGLACRNGAPIHNQVHRWLSQVQKGLIVNGIRVHQVSRRFGKKAAVRIIISLLPDQRTIGRTPDDKYLRLEVTGRQACLKGDVYCAG